MKKHTILIADDHELVRSGLSLVLGYQKDFTVVGAASNGEEAVAAALALRPDLIILDLMMPAKDGTQATREILAAFPSARIVILTTYATSFEILAALDAGAYGALSKDISNADLVQSLHDVLAGRHVLSPDIQNLIAANLESSALAARQVEILEMLARGLSNHDIATALRLSENGVKFHLRGLFAKLGAATRTEAVAVALRRRLL